MEKYGILFTIKYTKLQHMHTRSPILAVTLHAALENSSTVPARWTCSNDDPGLTLTYFTARSNLVPFVFWMGKCLSCRFPRNYWSLWGQYRCNEYMMIYDNPSSFKVTPRFNIFKLLFPQNTRPYEAKFHMEPPWDVGMKICSNGSHDQDGFQAHLKKNSSSEPGVW